ncbi:MAG: hypothetical protein V3S41_05970 [Spirochaetia bacterium]
MLGGFPGLNIDPSYRVVQYGRNNTVAAYCGFAYHDPMAICFKCEHDLPVRETIFRGTVCENCGSELRVCKNCGFYLPGAHWDCRETIPEAVREKERANFCEFFRPVPGTDTGDPVAPGAGSSDSSEGKARDRFNSLFGDS